MAVEAQRLNGRPFPNQPIAEQDQAVAERVAEQLDEQMVIIAPEAPVEMAAPADDIELTIEMPCLNEADSVGRCVDKAMAAIQRLGIKGEVVVADNGSTDGSAEIAREHGARVVHQTRRGYGYAHMKGIESARGRFILLADSDDAFDFDDLELFLRPLRSGVDMVVGNRFKGKQIPGSLPWMHRYVGNPVLSGLLNLFFHTGIGDAHCGKRAFRREAYTKMHLQTGGMEFASEMIIHASKARLKIAEVPTTVYPRLTGQAKLNSVRDGWRHLRFMLLYSPTHLFIWPGMAMMAVGLAVMSFLALGPVDFSGMRFGFHWMFVCALLAMGGFELMSMGFLARFYSLSSRFDNRRDRVLRWFGKHFSLEKGVSLGVLVFVVGVLFDLSVVLSWLQGGPIVSSNDFGSIRLSILALTLSVIGIQVVFSSFLVSMMAIKRRGWK